MASDIQPDSYWGQPSKQFTTLQNRATYTATMGQTVFTIVYTVGTIDVYMDGIKLLAGTDFTAATGTNITLTSACLGGEVIECIGYI